MVKSKRAKKKVAKKRNKEMDKMNGEVKERVYNHHKAKKIIKIEQDEEIFDENHNEPQKFKKLCKHDELKGAILEEDITFTRFKLDESSINKEVYSSGKNNRNENAYNIALNLQSNTEKYQVYKKDKETDKIKLSQGFEVLEEDVEYDFKTFIPQ